MYSFFHTFAIRSFFFIFLGMTGIPFQCRFAFMWKMVHLNKLNPKCVYIFISSSVVFHTMQQSICYYEWLIFVYRTFEFNFFVVYLQCYISYFNYQ